MIGYPFLLIQRWQPTPTSSIPNWGSTVRSLAMPGDGNLHTVNFALKADVDQQARLQEFNDRVVQKAIALDGTGTGEHGVGIGKQKYMVYEHGEAAVETMRQIKQLFDPNDILNPGKVVVVPCRKRRKNQIGRVQCSSTVKAIINRIDR